MIGVTRGIAAKEFAGRRFGAVGSDQQLTLQVAVIAQAHAHVGLVDQDLKDACIDEYGAGSGRRVAARRLQGAALDDVPKVGLAQFRAIEIQRARSLRWAAQRWAAPR